jgi:hypothetical protein
MLSTPFMQPFSFVMMDPNLLAHPLAYGLVLES